MNNLGDVEGVTDTEDESARSERDLVGMLSRMTMRHAGRSSDLIRMAISNLQMAAQVDPRVGPICSRAIAALSGPASAERDTTGVYRGSGGGALRGIDSRRG